MPRLTAFLFLLLFPLLSPLILLRAFETAPMPTVTDLNKLIEPGKYRVTLRIDDHNRNLVYVTPKGFKPGEKLPLVFFFHGAGGSAQQASRTYGWTEKADAERFFVAFPEGLPLRPDSKGPFHVWRDERGEFASPIDDIHFFEVLLGKLEAVLPVDPHRIYVTGFSNGAGMTFTLGSHFSDRIAAIAPVSSQSFVRIDSLARPLPVFYLTGTADPFIPYHGGKMTVPGLPFGHDRDYPPVQETVDQWVHLDGCPSKPRLVDDKDNVRTVLYGPGHRNAEILFTTIDGNGHHWPGSLEPLPRAMSGPTLDPFNATDRIWDFFKKHPLK